MSREVTVHYHRGKEAVILLPDDIENEDVDTIREYVMSKACDINFNDRSDAYEPWMEIVTSERTEELGEI